MKSFKNYSEKLGNNFLLCQGPGGNTSIKLKEDIFIKKSGSLLKNSVNKNIFKKINLNDIEHFYSTTIKNNEKYENSLSIETPFHVLLQSKYVIHYHSISSILLSCLYQKSVLNPFLIKNKILPINYVRPGIEIAEEILNNNKKFNFKSFFLYNHGIILEGNDIKKLYYKCIELEKLFSNLIDYDELRIKSKEIFKLSQNEKKIKNPHPEVNYKNFNGKYLFPDHSVFFPHFFETKKNKKNSIYYDENHFLFEKDLSETELDYFKVLLILFGLINNNKIHNFINKDLGEKLRRSPDEELRIGINL